MLLGELLAEISPVGTDRFDPAVEVDSVTHDSRLAGPGAVFVAVPGFNHDGMRFTPAAVARGARAVVAASIPEAREPGVAYIAVEDVRVALARLSRRINGAPDERLRLYGVTGTNGKTSTAYFLAAILREAERRVGVMGTIGFDVDGEIRETPNTTPEGPVLHGILREAVESGVQDVVMEVSSHSLELERVAGMHFDVAMFTNLTKDHLELHGTMEQYYRAKRRLFESACACVSVIDVDDEWGARAARELEASGRRVITVARTREGADIRAERVVTSLAGTRFDLVAFGERVPVSLRALGDYNVNNALVAAGAALCQGYAPETVVAGLAAVEPVPGRLERVPHDDLDVFIDYAHTTDALACCLAALRGLSDAPITLVFGVLGDRVPQQRREMGEIAARADHVILTEDDLKRGTLDEVVADAGAALDEAGADWRLIENRWEAIAAGVERARLGDVVVIAGKGHERQLILPHGRGVIVLDEAAAVRAAFEGRDPRELDPR